MIEKYFNQKQQGSAMVACGILLIMYTIGIMSRMLSVVIIAAALLLIVYGSTLSGLTNRAKQWLNSRKR